MITLETKIRVEGEVVTLGEVIEMNELEFDEVADALTQKKGGSGKEAAQAARSATHRSRSNAAHRYPA